MHCFQSWEGKTTKINTDYKEGKGCEAHRVKDPQFLSMSTNATPMKPSTFRIRFGFWEGKIFKAFVIISPISLVMFHDYYYYYYTTYSDDHFKKLPKHPRWLEETILGSSISTVSQRI